MGINNKIIIVNMMMMMTTNPEYLATEDLAIAKSSVAISSAHQDDEDDEDDDDDDNDDKDEDDHPRNISSATELRSKADDSDQLPPETK